MKVLFLTRSLPFHNIGGMEAVAWDLAKEFARNGHDVDILTTQIKGMDRLSFVDGIRITQVEAPGGRYSNAWWWRSRNAYIRHFEGQLDLVLSVSAGAFSIPTRSKSTVFIVQVHGVAWGEFISKVRQKTPFALIKSIRNLAWLVRDFRYRSFDALVSVGEKVQQDLHSLPTKFLVGNTRVRLIQNGIEQKPFLFDEVERASKRAILKVQESLKIVISVSRLNSQKGIVEGLFAFRKALDLNSNLYYIIVGSGPDELHIKNVAFNLGLTDNVKFIGMIPRDQIAGWLSAADIFLFTSKRIEAGVTINVMEALASGLPVIASINIDAPIDGIRSIRYDDPDDIARKIIEASMENRRTSKLPPAMDLSISYAQYMNLYEDIKIEKQYLNK